MAEKEVWDGAGIDIDFEYLQPSEVDQVIAFVEGLASDEAKLRWIKRFFVEAEYRGISEWSSATKSDLCRKLRALERRIEAIAEMDAASRAASTPASRLAKHGKSKPEEIEVKDEGGATWNNSTAAVAIYALLRAAKLPKKHNREAVATFTYLLTGRSRNTMKEFHREAVNQTFTDQDAETVAEMFDKIGLRDLAADVRQKFYKT